MKKYLLIISITICLILLPVKKSESILPFAWYVSLAISTISHVVVGAYLLMHHNASTGGGTASSLMRVTSVNLVSGGFGVEQLSGEYSGNQNTHATAAEISAILGTAIIYDNHHVTVTSNGVLQSGYGWSGMSNPNQVSTASHQVTCERIADIVAKQYSFDQNVYMAINNTVPTSTNTYQCEVIAWGDSQLDMELTTPVPNTDPNMPGALGGVITFKEAGVPDAYAYISEADRNAHDSTPPPPNTNTPPPTPTDSDGDGVVDSADTCPGTPSGYPVDASGCPTDSDGDGVVDGADTCPGTPPGTTVDLNGCTIGTGTGTGTGDYGVGNAPTGNSISTLLYDPAMPDVSTLQGIETGALTTLVSGLYNNNPVIASLKNYRMSASGDCSLNASVYGSTIVFDFCQWQGIINTVGVVMITLSSLGAVFIVLRGF